MDSYQLAQARMQCSTIQVLLLAETKEYDAGWLPQAKSVLRDETGRFASKEGSFKEKAKALYEEDVKRHNREFSKKEFAKYLNSVPAHLEAAKDYVFGTSYKQKVDDLSKKLGELGVELKKIATKKYKEFEPKLKEMKGEEFEQAVQDELIKLKLINERTLKEDLREAKTAEDIKKLINQHQAEIMNAAIIVGQAVAISAGGLAAWTLGVVVGEALTAAVFGGTIPAFAAMFDEALIGWGIQQTAQPVSTYLIDKKVADKKLNKEYKEWAKLGVDMFAIVMGRNLAKAIKLAEEKATFKKGMQIAQKVMEDNAKAMAEHEKSILTKVGLDKLPKDFDTLESAYKSAMKKAAEQGNSLEKELSEINKIKQAYNDIRRRLLEQ
jgi:hypothetical protein